MLLYTGYIPRGVFEMKTQVFTLRNLLRLRGKSGQ